MCVILVSDYSVHALTLLTVWDGICLRPEIHRLVQIFPDMVSFLLTLNKLGIISSLAQNIVSQTFWTRTCYRSAFERLMQYLCCASFPLSPVGNDCWKNSMLLPRFLYCKTSIWVLRFVKSYWWTNFSHVAQRFYTSSINNFEPINASTNKAILHTAETWTCSKQSSKKSGVIPFSGSDYFLLRTSWLWGGWIFLSHVLFSLTCFIKICCLPWGQIYNILIA